MILGTGQEGFREISDAVDAVELAQAAEHHREPRVIVVNAATRGASLPKGCVVWNFENIGQQVDDKEIRYWVSQASEIWDFSKTNVQKLRESNCLTRDCVKAKHVRVGYHPSMVRFRRRPENEQDIDVAFFGMPNERREKVIADLVAAGLRVYWPGAQGMFGAARDEVYARSKIALSMLFYEGGVFPALRTLHAAANGVPVISELHPEADRSVLWAVPYHELAKFVIHVLNPKLESLSNDFQSKLAPVMMSAFPLQLPEPPKKAAP